MTHDELLAEVDRRIERVNETFYKPNTGALEIQDLMISSLLALRAVLELHKPVLDTYTTPLDLDPPEVRERYECGICCVYYPCPTIQAIEKELK